MGMSVKKKGMMEKGKGGFKRRWECLNKERYDWKRKGRIEKKMGMSVKKKGMMEKGKEGFKRRWECL